jgi:hypothetical protein
LAATGFSWKCELICDKPTGRSVPNILWFLGWCVNLKKRRADGQTQKADEEYRNSR